MATEEYRKAGNSFFEQGKYKEAIEQYTKGLKIENDNVLLLSNRAACYLQLNDGGSALKDCELGLSKQPDHVKLMFRFCKSLILLRSFAKALPTIEKLNSRSPQEEDIKLAYKIIKNGAQEELEGKYDADKMVKESEINMQLPSTHANYINTKFVELGLSQGRHCFIAKTEIPFGTLIIAEKAPVSISLTKMTAGSTNPSEYLSSELRKDKAASFRIFSLLSNPAENTPEPMLVSQVKLLFSEIPIGLAIWVNSHLFPQCCFPNSAFFMIGDFIFFHTVKTIQSGEVLTVNNYPPGPYITQSSSLSKCSCKRCVFFKTNPNKILIEKNLEERYRMLEQNIPMDFQNLHKYIAPLQSLTDDFDREFPESGFSTNFTRRLSTLAHCYEFNRDYKNSILVYQKLTKLEEIGSFGEYQGLLSIAKLQQKIGLSKEAEISKKKAQKNFLERHCGLLKLKHINQFCAHVL